MKTVTLELTIPQLRAIAIFLTEEHDRFLVEGSRLYISDQLAVAAYEGRQIITKALAEIDIEYVRQLGGSSADIPEG